MASGSSIGATTTSGVAGFFDWWLGELAMMVPRAQATKERPTCFIDIDVGDAVVRRVGGRQRELRRIVLAGLTPDLDGLGRPPKRGPELRLPPEMVLMRRLELPRAAERQLEQILRHEFGSRIPYAAEDAYYDFEVVKRRGRMIEVELYCALKARIDDLRARLAERRLSPATVTVDGAKHVDLLRSLRQGEGSTARTVTRLALLASAALLAFVVWRPLDQRMTLVAELEAETQAARAAANATLALEAEADELRARRRELTRVLSGGAPRVVLIDELSQLLPDSAWLRRLSIQGETLQLSGEAEQAAPLIAELEASELFASASFVSPVTITKTNVERFELMLVVAEQPESDPEAAQ